MRDLTSSSDVIADRRYGYAKAALEERDFAAARDLFEQTLELAPNWPPALFGLGEAERAMGHAARAKAAFRKALALDPADRLGAAMQLALLGEGDGASAMSSAYVAHLFDDYAPRFENHLLRNLEYRGPEILSEMLRAGAAKAGRPFRFGHVIDLGCGTGLMAAALQAQAARITGVDLSQKMLAKARKTTLYRRLVHAEMTAFLAAEPEESADLVIAADAFVYLGPLESICRAARRVLQKGGLLAFTTQAEGQEDYRLGEELRFSHSEAYLRRALKEAGLRLAVLQSISARMNLGVPVPGFAVVAERS